MARAPGPNDFHFENGVQMPGLGEFEPDDTTKEAVLAEAEANRIRQQVLDEQAAENRAAEEANELRQQRLDEKEAELLRFEKKLRDLAAQIPDGVTEK